MITKYACEEHIEVVIDMMIDETEAFPVLTKLESGNNSSTSCELCSGKVIYMVANK